MINARLSSLFFGAVLLLLGTGCGKLPGKPTPADIPMEPKDVRDFAKLYSLNCAGCHGVEGKGNGALALNNPVYLSIASDEVLKTAASKGVAGKLMPAFAISSGGTLTDEQIDIIVTGIRSHWGKPLETGGAKPPPYAATLAGDAGRGAAVYATACQTCHGPEGKGAKKSGSIVDGSFLALVSDQSLRNTIIAGRPGRNHPDWEHCIAGQPLTDEQVTDVVAWLVSHRAATPGQPYTQKP